MQSGTILGGNVRLDTPIGRGGAGEVWRGVHLTLGRPVAVKILTGHTSDDATRERFAREARLVAQLQHPNIVQVFDAASTSTGLPYLVLELLEGVDLKSHLGAGPMPLAEVTTLLDQLCDALTYAHAVGIVHRDIKPANVFLLRHPRWPTVKLVDFGIAKPGVAEPDKGLTVTGLIMGTPYYMSPEQFIHPRSVDHRTDLWSVAVTAYAALAGTVPFKGETVAAISVQVHTGRFDPISKLNPALAPLDAWFARALATDVAHRFSSAAELAATFREAASTPATRTSADVSASHGAVPSRTAAPAPPARGPVVRRARSGLLTLGLAAGGALAIGGGAAAWSVGVFTSSAERASARDLDADEDADTRGPSRRGASAASPMTTPLVASGPGNAAPPALPPTATTATATTATATAAAPQATPTASAQGPAPSLSPSKPAATATASATCQCPSWRPRKTVCKKADATKSCSSCCQPGDKLTPYPSCECMLDACRLPGSVCSP